MSSYMLMSLGSMSYVDFKLRNTNVSVSNLGVENLNVSPHMSNGKGLEFLKLAFSAYEYILPPLTIV